MGKLFNPPPDTPLGHVTQLKTVGGRRWIAHCPPTLCSFFWMASSDPDDKPGGERLPAAASGPLADGQALGFPAWAPSRCGSCFFCLWAASFLCRAFFTQSHSGPEELAGSYLRRGPYDPPAPGLYFTQRCLDPKAYRKVVSGPSPWRSGVLDREVRVQKHITLCPHSSITFSSDLFFPNEIPL